jgi:hypothetical protein
MRREPGVLATRRCILAMSNIFVSADDGMFVSILRRTLLIVAFFILAARYVSRKMTGLGAKRTNNSCRSVIPLHSGRFPKGASVWLPRKTPSYGARAPGQIDASAKRGSRP